MNIYAIAKFCLGLHNAFIANFLTPSGKLIMQTTLHNASTPTVLILGARGRFGLCAARTFADAGWHVVGQMRPNDAVPLEAAKDSRIRWIAKDLTDTQALVASAQEAVVVVHALNPLYTNKAWQEQVLPMQDASIAIARTLGATLMVPGNVYNFGASMPAVLHEDTPHLASTVKGRVRVAMEEALQQSGVRAVIIRAGNFFGGGRGTLFDTAMVKDIQKGVFTDPGEGNAATAWAYLPDLARTFVAVAQRRADLPQFEVLHFSGYSINAVQWKEALDPVALKQGWVKPARALRMASLPWGIIRVGGWFNAVWASLAELRYLGSTTHALANDRLTALIGAEPHTPLVQAAHQALADLGLLNSSLPSDQSLVQTQSIHSNALVQ
jgi:nucleoside-diphosphate-sugar epimerase